MFIAVSTRFEGGGYVHSVGHRHRYTRTPAVINESRVLRCCSRGECKTFDRNEL